MKDALKFREKGEIQALSKALPSVDEIQIKPHLQRVKQYCDYLSKISNNKPAKLNSLLNSIQSVLKLNAQQLAQEFTNILIKQNIVKQESTKLIYNDSSDRGLGKPRQNLFEYNNNSERFDGTNLIRKFLS